MAAAGISPHFSEPEATTVAMAEVADFFAGAFVCANPGTVNSRHTDNKVMRHIASLRQDNLAYQWGPHKTYGRNDCKSRNAVDFSYNLGACATSVEMQKGLRGRRSATAGARDVANSVAAIQPKRGGFPRDSECREIQLRGAVDHSQPCQFVRSWSELQISGSLAARSRSHSWLCEFYNGVQSFDHRRRGKPHGHQCLCCRQTTTKAKIRRGGE